MVMASSVEDQGHRIGEPAALGCRAMPRAVVGEILPVTSRGRARVRGRHGVYESHRLRSPGTA